MATDKARGIWRSSPLGLALLLAMAGWAGPGWAGQQPATGSQAPATAQPAKKATAKPAPSAKKVAKPAPVPRTARKARAPVAKEKAQAKVPAQTAASKSETAELTGGGRRDPFKIPVYGPPAPGQPGEGEMITGPLPPGKRGLLISQLKLQGIVRLDTTNQMIAVVTNFTRRAYFLRENDAVYNGLVSKITPDSVFFQENFLDSTGKVTTREVVKRLGPAPGEGR